MVSKDIEEKGTISLLELTWDLAPSEKTVQPAIVPGLNVADGGTGG